MKYEKLFEKGRIGRLELRNRVVMTAMGVMLGDWNGCATPEYARFYEERAKGGCGLIIPEFTSVDPDSGHCNRIQLGIYDARQIRSMEDICDAVHRHGAKIFVQLHHGGREAPPALNGGRQAMAPSVELNSVIGRDTILPREMTVEDIDRLVGLFVQAAVNSELAGADGVEIHGAHGYLLQQFMSPYTNKRTDEYGGSMENRCRFMVRILEGIREAVGPNFVVGARINGNDFVEGGNDQDACVEIAKLPGALRRLLQRQLRRLCQRGHDDRALLFARGLAPPLRRGRKARGEGARNRRQRPAACDFVGMSRMHIADPYLVAKAKAGREDLIRKCLKCMNCNKSVVAGRNLHCAINPVAGRETRFGDDKLIVNGAGRPVAIIGGGPAGMEAALLMKKRGFAPVIFEKSGKLGGSAILASKAPCKQMAQEFVDTQAAEMKEYGIEVHLNTPATASRLKALDPYCVVIACGGEQIVPKIPGADSENVYYIEDVLLGRVKFEGKRVAVIGGGHVGLEVAHYLCADNKVTVVEMQKEVGASIYRTAKYKLLALLCEAGVEILTQHAIAGVKEGAAVLKKMDTGEEVEIAADVVVMALGNRPDTAYIDSVASVCEKTVVIGDAVSAGTMADATRAAYEKCFYI